jgi:hypothetical protein
MVQLLYIHTLPLWISHPYQLQPENPIYCLVSPNTLSSVGGICDSGCAITFTSDKVTIKHDTAITLDGTHDRDSDLWRVPLGEPVPGHSLLPCTAHNLYDKKSIQDTIAYLHAC